MQAEIGEHEGDEKRRMGRELLKVSRESGESLTQYVLRRVSAFHESEQAGCPLPDQIKGMLLEEGAGLTGQSLENYHTLAQGRLDFASVRNALMRLDPKRSESVLPTAARGSRGNYFAGAAEEVASQGTSDHSAGAFLQETESEAEAQALSALEESGIAEDEVSQFMEVSILLRDTQRRGQRGPSSRKLLRPAANTDIARETSPH